MQKNKFFKKRIKIFWKKILKKFEDENALKRNWKFKKRILNLFKKKIEKLKNEILKILKKTVKNNFDKE